MNTTIMIAGTVINVLGLAICLAFEYKNSKARIVFKMIASTGFLMIAVAGGAFDSTYGYIVFAALVLCWIGDLLLALPGDVVFLAGLVSFLLGHVGFVVAFLNHGVAWRWSVASLAALVPVCVVVVRWVYPHVPKEMKVPVLAYIGVISTMVLLSAGAVGAGAHVILLCGAVAFFLSDIFVARDRFVTPGYSNRIIGLPLYYLGVVLLAFSIAAQCAGAQ